jgi:hypothetical protein
MASVAVQGGWTSADGPTLLQQALSLTRGDILEHVPDPQAAVREAARVLPRRHDAV